MQVCKRDNSLAVCLPAVVVEALGRNEDEQVEIHVAGPPTMAIGKMRGHATLIKRLRKYRELSPADFKWDRLEATG